MGVGDMQSVVHQIGDLAEAGERMIERLRRKAFLPDSRKGLNVRFGIAEAAQLLGCSTNRIRMAEDDGRLPPAPAAENGRRVGYTVEDLLTMRQVLGASPARAGLDVLDQDAALRALFERTLRAVAQRGAEMAAAARGGQ